MPTQPCAPTRSGESTNRGGRGAWLAWASAALFFTALCAANAIRTSDAGQAGDMEFVETFAFGVVFFVLWVAVFGRVWPAVTTAFVLFAWWWPAELYLRLHYQAPLSPQFLALVLESNLGEVKEFFLTFRDELALAAALVAAVSMPALVLCRRYPVRWSHRSRGWCLLLFPALGIFMYALFEQQEPSWLEAAPDAFRVEPLAFWSDKWRGVFPMTLPLAVKRYRDDAVRIAGLREQIAGFRFGASSAAKPLDAVVLVIGESASASHWSLGGYARQTNPLLEKRANLVYLGNVVSPGVATRYAVPFIVARHPVIEPAGPARAPAEASLIVAFNEVGYHSAWLSNQSPIGFWDTSSAFYARDAHYTRFLNPSGFQHQGSYDDLLLPALDAQLRLPGPALVVLHTLGSHFNYAHRYPPPFDRFQPSSSASSAGMGSAEQEKRAANNAYDNSILYTDHLLDQILGRLNAAGRRSVLAYVSDHGEDVSVPGCPAAAKTRETGTSFRVPALIWMSDTLALEKKAQLDQLRRAAASPLQSNALFPILLDVAGIELGGKRAGSSMLAGGSPGGARMVINSEGRWADFDSAEKRDACRIGPERAR